jgi:CubicO group peptidase (beta-lactamase class C family)
VAEPALSLTEADVESVLLRALETSGAIGAQLAVSRGADLIECAAGIANAEHGSALTTDTVLQAGSFAKMYTATLVHQLADDGLLDLDVPVREYLPEFRLGDPAAAATVTPRHLLSMTSGLDFGSYYDFGTGRDVVQRYVQTLAGHPVLFAPGTAFSYSGSSTVISALLVERLRGLPYAEALHAHLLGPGGLGLTHPDAGQYPYLRMAAGHVRHDDGTASVIRPWGTLAATAANGTTLVSTAGDLARFARLLLAGGLAADGSRVLSAAGVQRMHARQIPVRAEMIAQHWCLGPYVRRVQAAGGLDLDIFGHGGRWSGGVCDVLWVPALDLAVATATNTPGRAGALIQSVCGQLLPRLIGPQAWIVPVLQPGLPADADRYAGRYASRTGEYEVSVAGEALQFTFRPKEVAGTAFSLPPSARQLHPIGPGRFLPAEDTPVERRLQEIWFGPDSGPAEFVYDGLIAGRRVG